MIPKPATDPAAVVLEPLTAVLPRRTAAHHAFESCVEQLGIAIRLGAYPQGSTLPPERELAERLGVSRPTLREAIAALREAGLLDTVRGRSGGTIVLGQPESARRRPTKLGERKDELLESLVFRRIVEAGACEVASSRQLDTAQRQLLLTTLMAVEQSGGHTAHRQADSRLHLTISILAGSRQLVEAVTRVQADLHTLLMSIPVLSVNIEHSTKQHRAIVEAIVDGDGPGARRSMEQHCDDTAALLRGLLA